MSANNGFSFSDYLVRNEIIPRQVHEALRAAGVTIAMRTLWKWASGNHKVKDIYVVKLMDFEREGLWRITPKSNSHRAYFRLHKEK